MTLTNYLMTWASTGRRVYSRDGTTVKTGSKLRPFQISLTQIDLQQSSVEVKLISNYPTGICAKCDLKQDVCITTESFFLLLHVEHYFNAIMAN